MNLMNYTREVESWQPGLKCASRDQAFDQILKTLCDEAFYQVNSELTHDVILEALIERESQRSTAMGEEIAFPHARLENLNQALFAIATLDEPVLFEENPVRVICMILVPASEPTVSLKMMAQFSRILMDVAALRRVFDARNPNDLRAVFSEHNLRIDKPVIARDIMRTPCYSVRETDSVSTCSRLMSTHHLQAVPVVNESREIIGEITVDRLFRYGLPDFFSSLKSVSFIAEFDPFEKYFADERETQASEMMQTNARIVPKDYTIMEIVFDLAIQSCAKLYVVDGDGRWIGTIDKGLVLDNVINI